MVVPSETVGLYLCPDAFRDLSRGSLCSHWCDDQVRLEIHGLNLLRRSVREMGCVHVVFGALAVSSQCT